MPRGIEPGPKEFGEICNEIEALHREFSFVLMRNFQNSENLPSGVGANQESRQ